MRTFVYILAFIFIIGASFINPASLYGLTEIFKGKKK